MNNKFFDPISNLGRKATTTMRQQYIFECVNTIDKTIQAIQAQTKQTKKEKVTIENV